MIILLLWNIFIDLFSSHQRNNKNKTLIVNRTKTAGYKAVVKSHKFELKTVPVVMPMTPIN